MIYITQSRISS